MALLEGSVLVTYRRGWRRRVCARLARRRETMRLVRKRESIRAMARAAEADGSFSAAASFRRGEAELSRAISEL